MSNIDIPNDIPKYRKKSTASPPAKAKHKHVYEPCLLERPIDWYLKEHLRCGKTDLGFSSYCPVCGRVGPIDVERWFVSIKCLDIDFEPYIKNKYSEEAQLELDPKTRTLPVFRVKDPFARSVDIGEESMTKQEAITLENRCDKIMSGYLGRSCTVSMALSGKLKIEFNDGDFITWNMAGNHVDYINYAGFYSDLEDDINSIQACMADDNYTIFEKLMWSYNHRNGLEE